MKKTLTDYEYIEPGISRYWHRYRALASVGGKQQQKFFETLEEARDWRERILIRNAQEHERGLAYAMRTVVRGDKDLPVGVYESYQTRYLESGEVALYPFIGALCFDKGKTVFTCTRRFGRRRTREEAIEEVVRERKKFEEDYWG